MRAPVSTDSFLKVLVASKLVQKDDLTQYLKSRAKWPRQAEKTATLLVNDGLLTGFQTKMLLSGEHWNLFLGPYKILEQIGRGGMGEVYLSEHTTLGRLCALKVLPGKQARNPEFRERFFREARAIAQLDHPNIVRIYDCHSGGDLPYIALEYIDGPNLSQVVKSHGPLPYSAAAGYVMQACAGLQHAHERGILHRDIKPHNLLRDPQGNIKLLDMGLARIFGGDDQEEEEGNVMGTADYISPEQAIDSATADGRSDVYSLGGTLYHLLAGQPPFAGRTVQQILVAHQVHEAPPLHELNPGVPRGLAAVVAKMMAKNPDRRYQNPLEVRRALEPWARHTVEPKSERTSRNGKASEDTQTHRLSTARTRTDLPKSNPGVAEDSSVELPPPPDLLHVRLHPAVIFGVLAAVGLAVLVTLALVVSSSKDGADGKSSDQNAAQKSGQDAASSPHSVSVFRGHAGPVEGIVTLRDGWRILSGSRDGTVRVWDIAGAKELKSWDFARPVTAIAVNADESRLAVASDGRFVALWDLRAEKELRRWKTKAGVDSVGFTPDGKTIFAVSGAQLLAWPIDRDEPRLDIKTPSIHLWHAAVTPDGAHFVTVGADADEPEDNSTPSAAKHAVRFWRTDNGELVSTFSQHQRSVRRIDVNHDGSRLASSSSGGVIMVWDTVGGDVLFRFSAHRGSVNCARFLPGTKRLVSCGDDNLVKIWSEGNTMPQTLRGHSDKVYFVEPSADGKHVFSGSADKTIRMWKVSE